MFWICRIRGFSAEETHSNDSSHSDLLDSQVGSNKLYCQIIVIGTSFTIENCIAYLTTMYLFTMYCSHSNYIYCPLSLISWIYSIKTWDSSPQLTAQNLLNSFTHFQCLQEQKGVSPIPCQPLMDTVWGPHNPGWSPPL